jgi:hypothetical protein
MDNSEISKFTDSIPNKSQELAPLKNVSRITRNGACIPWLSAILHG